MPENIDIRYFRRLSELGEKMEANTYEMSLEEARRRVVSYFSYLIISPDL